MRSLPLLLTALLIVTACDYFADDEPRGVLVAVQKFAPGDGCEWISLTPDATVDGTELVDDVCPGTADPHLLGGSDRVRLVIDYGDDLEFDPGTILTQPAIVVTLDGIETSVDVSVDTLPRDGRAMFLAVFTVPAQQTAQMAITVQASPGFAKRVSRTFSIEPPVVSLDVVCADPANCEREGAVGNATAIVTVPGTIPHTVALLSEIDGEIQEQTYEVMTALAAGGTATEGRREIPVPVVPDGTRWFLRARLGPSQDVFGPILIRRPDIRAAIVCGAPCTVTAGEEIGIEVTAPRHISVREARITATVNGVPLLNGQVLALTLENVSTNTVSGRQTVPIPDQPDKVLAIDVSVAGYHATGILAKIVAAPPPP